MADLPSPAELGPVAWASLSVDNELLLAKLKQLTPDDYWPQKPLAASYTCWSRMNELQRSKVAIFYSHLIDDVKRKILEEIRSETAAKANRDSYDKIRMFHIFMDPSLQITWRTVLVCYHRFTLTH